MCDVSEQSRRYKPVSVSYPLRYVLIAAIRMERPVGANIGAVYDSMVRFKDVLEILKRPEAPPVCPKCGSHRTEVIGNTDGGDKRMVRCNACGAISQAPRTTA